MPIKWVVEEIEASGNDGAFIVHWRVNGDGGVTCYGTVSIDGLTVTPQTTEADVVEKVKRALNAVAEQRDEHGNIVPPKPGEETAKTDAIEKSLADQAAELLHPKVKSVALPWKHVA